MPNFSPCRKSACNSQGEFMPALESSCSGVIGWDASPVRNYFFFFFMRFASGSNGFYNSFYFLPASRLFTAMQRCTCPTHLQECIAPLLPPNLSFRLVHIALYSGCHPSSAPFVIWLAESLETVLLQGFTEISLDRGQLWSENLRQENRGALILGAHQSL